MKNKIWYYRNQKGLTLQQLSRLSGLSVAALNKIENGYTNDILLTNAIAISKALKVDIYELFCIIKN
jgi:transcriptional regulator with XRE-family HTH domain